MKWVDKKKRWSNWLFHEDISIYFNGESHICSKFLFFPKQINGEVRWLEYVKWKQTFHTNKLSDYTPKYSYSYWRDDKWD